MKSSFPFKKASILRFLANSETLARLKADIVLLELAKDLLESNHLTRALVFLHQIVEVPAISQP